MKNQWKWHSKRDLNVIVGEGKTVCLAVTSLSGSKLEDIGTGSWEEKMGIKYGWKGQTETHGVQQGRAGNRKGKLSRLWQ